MTPQPLKDELNAESFHVPKRFPAISPHCARFIVPMRLPAFITETAC